MKHNLLIECGPATSEDLMRQWSAVCDGLCEYNAHWFADNRNKIDGPLPRYEDPRGVFNDHGGRVADQALGTAPVIHARGKATCFDWCAYVAGLLRFQGDLGARVILIPVVGEYERAIPYRYHALVETGDGEILDPTCDLPGYQGTDEWWTDHGHCCKDCALGTHEPEEQPCPDCETAQAAGCKTGTCGLKGRREKFRSR